MQLQLYLHLGVFALLDISLHALEKIIAYVIHWSDHNNVSVEYFSPICTSSNMHVDLTAFSKCMTQNNTKGYFCLANTHCKQTVHLTSRFCAKGDISA